MRNLLELVLVPILVALLFILLPASVIQGLTPVSRGGLAVGIILFLLIALDKINNYERQQPRLLNILIPAMMLWATAALMWSLHSVMIARRSAGISQTAAAPDSGTNNNNPAKHFPRKTKGIRESETTSHQDSPGQENAIRTRLALAMEIDENLQLIDGNLTRIRKELEVLDSNSKSLDGPAPLNDSAWNSNKLAARELLDEDLFRRLLNIYRFASLANRLIEDRRVELSKDRPSTETLKKLDIQLAAALPEIRDIFSAVSGELNKSAPRLQDRQSDVPN
jgi:hypothetical protein